MSLQAEIDQARLDIRTDGYQMSIGEWVSLYKKGEVDVHPELQKFFGWTHTEKSRFIESVLLGIPCPQVVAAQRSDAVWDVVDGLPGLATLFELMGILKDERGERVEPLRLEETQRLPSLRGMRWDSSGGSEKALTEAQRWLITRAKINTVVIHWDGGDETRHELFQRLSLAGAHLSDQALRDSSLLMLNRDFSRWLKELSKDPFFQEAIAPSDRSADEQHRMELVLRFVAFRTMEDSALESIGDVAQFLKHRAIELAQSPSFDREEEAAAFRATFAVLAQASESFRKHDPRGHRYSGGFLITPFELMAYGVGYNVKKLKASRKDVRAAVEGLWENPDFLDHSRSMLKLVSSSRRFFA